MKSIPSDIQIQYRLKLAGSIPHGTELRIKKQLARVNKRLQKLEDAINSHHDLGQSLEFKRYTENKNKLAKLQADLNNYLNKRAYLIKQLERVGVFI